MELIVVAEEWLFMHGWAWCLLEGEGEGEGKVKICDRLMRG